MRFCAVVCLLALVVLTAGPVSGAAELEAIKKTYAGLSSVQARFQQRIYIQALKKERGSKGEFFYKRSKGFLWRYTVPKAKLFLYDGKAVWQEEEGKAFVLREKVDREKMGGSFLDLVEDISKLDQFFTVKQASRQGSLTLIDLSPKKEGTIQSARVWIDDTYVVTKLEITEITGNVNAITFSDIRTGVQLPDSLFRFDPGNKEVVER